MSLSQAASAIKQAVAPTFSSSSSSLVRQALISQGPQTTSSLHSYLHASSSPLPARPPPRNFLSGARRASLAPSPSASSSTKPFPGQPDSTNGAWSMSFLKKKVLHGMESRGEVLKMTRAKWDKVAARGTPAGEADAATAVGGEGQSARSAKGVRAKEEEHVWVVRSLWEEALAKGPSGRELAEREARRTQGEEQLREEYGLNA